MVTKMGFVTVRVVIVNTALLEPAATVTLDGTVSTEVFPLESETVVAAVADALSVTVP